MPLKVIDGQALSIRYRERLVDVANRKILISRIAGSGQESDLSEPPNARGLGRIRHFHRGGSARWGSNPLPLDPARSRLGLPSTDVITSQVYQNAACNWRCWYCYVPFDMLAARANKSEWVAVADLVEEYATLPVVPPVLDLSGGQPELTPEWILWTMDELEARGLDRKTYLWSDDNLSNDYFWKCLTAGDRHRIAQYRNYGKVGCFKGFDSASFAFNTSADPVEYERQFELFERYLAENLDIYAYVTLTHPGCVPSIDTAMEKFVDRLQGINKYLPLRTVPLEIAEFGPVTGRLDHARRLAMGQLQYEAYSSWERQIKTRFSEAERSLPIQEVRCESP
jgi:uncharacterized Fe-S cluster-containing radical SAM superfamily protein